MPARKKSSSSTQLIIVLLVIIAFFIYRQQKKTSKIEKTNVERTTTASQEKTIAGDNSNLLLGNPTNAIADIKSPNNYLVDHQYYVESYNNSNGGPNWVSWHLSQADLGNAERQDNFRPDESLPNNFFRADDNAYKNSGFDRGHNCPSADRTISEEANASTFLMNNIIPQAPNNNQNVWEHLESYCRSQVRKGKEAYIITGNYGSGGTGRNGYKSTIAGGKINVPAHIWKVVVLLPDDNNDLARIGADTRVIAIDTPNENNVSKNWMDYLTTVDEIESRCKCDLLSALPVDIQAQIESKKFIGGN